MRFDKGLGIWGRRDYSQGYIALPTDRTCYDHERIPLGLSLVEIQEQPFLEQCLPALICLRARLHPLTLSLEEVKPVWAEYGRNQESLPSCQVYASKDPLAVSSCHRGIQLIYLGKGSYRHKETGEETPIINGMVQNYPLKTSKGESLFEKTFVHQTPAFLKLAAAVTEDGVIITPPGLKDAYPLWGYGGFYKEGCGLHQIEQILFSIVGYQSTGREFSTIKLSRMSTWKEHGIFPMAGGRVDRNTIVFMNTFKNTLSLQGSVEGGEASIKIAYGRDENNQEALASYYSYRAIQQEGFPNEIDIYFRRGQ